MAEHPSLGSNNSLGVQISSILNKEDGQLPFGYFSPETDGKLTWNCGVDHEGCIISVFCYDFGTHKDKKVAQLDSMERAIYTRDELVKAGWHKLKPPEVTVSYGDDDKRPLTRKQKRYLARKLKKMAKNNPLAGEGSVSSSAAANDKDPEDNSGSEDTAPI